MNYFGVDDAIIGWLADELEASAPHFDGNAQAAMIYLSKELAKLAPLYEEICKYCGSDGGYTDAFDVSDGGVVYAYKHLIAKNKSLSTTG